MTRHDDEREIARLIQSVQSRQDWDLDAAKLIVQAGFHRAPTITEEMPGFLALTAAIEEAFAEDPTIPAEWITAAPVAAMAARKAIVLAAALGAGDE